MGTPLEKAHRDPGSMKGKILISARRIFGTYGFHGTTTRMIAHEAGIDISTLHYHWGDKGRLYEAVIRDIYEDLRRKLAETEAVIHGQPLDKRMDIAIDMMTDYLFQVPEISNLILFRYFGKTRHDAGLDIQVPEIILDISRSMDLGRGRKDIPARVQMEVLAMMNAIHNFISGETFFRPMLKLKRDAYIREVKATLKFILIPAFARSNARTRKPRGKEVQDGSRPGRRRQKDRTHQ